MVDSSDVSVLVHGPIENGFTLKCLKSIKKYLPKAQVIISTWKNSDLSKVTKLCDILIVNEDPGAINFGPGMKNNTVRMLTTIKSGLEKCDRKYILKMRSDLLLLNDKILKISDKYKRIEEFKLYKERIITNDIYTFKYQTNSFDRHYFPFQVSDWWHFGLNEDVKTLFDIPIPKEPEFSKYFLLKQNKEKLKSNFIYYDTLHWQFPTEQYIHSTCAKKHFPQIKLDNMLDYNETNIEQSEKFIVNNYLIVNKDISGINIQKAQYEKFDWIEFDHIYPFDSVYNTLTYEKDYKKYIDSDYELPDIKLYMLNIKLRTKKLSLRKHFLRLISSFMFYINPIIALLKPLFIAFREFLSLLFYAIQFVSLILQITKRSLIKTSNKGAKK